MQYKKFSILNYNFISGSLLLVIFLVNAASAIEVAKFAYKFAPENLNNRTLRVDGDMVAMAENIYVSTTANGIDTLVDTPSIFFIIDNSLSMTGDNGTDRNGNRFTVTSALLDTLQKYNRPVEVGLAIFGTTLYGDPADTFYFKTCPGEQGAYVPLVQLNKVYSTLRGNKTGYTILKEILATRNGNLIYRPTNNAFNKTNTNITAGFDAAKDAFKSSINAANHNRQFIIFFSDGEANIPDTTMNSGVNRPQTFHFVKGDSVPTTFTVFFSTTKPPTVPPRLDTMTTNIRNNGWSQNNPKSTNWGYQNTTQAALTDFLMSNVLAVITSNMKITPKSISLGGTTETNWVNGMFTFPSLFPLTGPVTPFNFSITYSIYNNSIYIKDTVHSISNLNVRIDPAVNLPADSFDVRHWDRNVRLRSNNVTVTTINETMDSLELVFDFDPETALYNYTNVKVQVTNQLGTIKDNETYDLIKKSADTFSIKFMRVTTLTPVQGNEIFEHQGIAGDSLVAVFRNSENPRLPLDTLRIAVPLNVSPLPLLVTAVTKDLDGNGYIDHIEISFNKKAGLDNSMVKGFVVKGNGYAFPVDSISKINDSTYFLCLHEVKTALPQTSWTPQVNIVAIPIIQPVENFLSTDGCPPVVWQVQKYIADSLRTDDTVKIFLSEKITGKTGGPFTIGNIPSNVFHVWVKNGSSFALADTMFSGIQSFTKVDRDSILIFTMSNGKNLTSNNYLNIQSEDSLVRDNNGNFPTDVNQRVQVMMGAVVLQIATGPNPARPALMHSEPMAFQNNQNAVTWARQGQGTYISLKNLTRPLNPDDAKSVSGTLKILDLVGNTVDWCSTNDIFDNLGNTAQSMNIYWNGLNHTGMPVAPGVYRFVVYVNYPGASKISNAKAVIKMGITH